MLPLSFEPKYEQRHLEARLPFFDFEIYVAEETGRFISNIAVV